METINNCDLGHYHEIPLSEFKRDIEFEFDEETCRIEANNYPENENFKYLKLKDDDEFRYVYLSNSRIDNYITTESNNNSIDFWIGNDSAQENWRFIHGLKSQDKFIQKLHKLTPQLITNAAGPFSRRVKMIAASKFTNGQCEPPGSFFGLNFEFDPNSLVSTIPLHTNIKWIPSTKYGINGVNGNINEPYFCLMSNQTVDESNWKNKYPHDRTCQQLIFFDEPNKNLLENFIKAQHHNIVARMETGISGPPIESKLGFWYNMEFKLYVEGQGKHNFIFENNTLFEKL